MLTDTSTLTKLPRSSGYADLHPELGLAERVPQEIVTYATRIQHRITVKLALSNTKKLPKWARVLK